MDNKAQWALVGAAWFLAISVAVLGWLAYRHFSAPAGGPAPVAGLAGPLAPGEKTLCPVTKQAVIVGPDTPMATYKGETYYFAPGKDAKGHDNKTLFLMDPLLYLTGVSGLKPPVPAAASGQPVAAPASPTAAP